MGLQKVYKTIEIEELVKEIGIWSNNPSEKKMELFSDLNQAKEYAIQTIQKLVGLSPSFSLLTRKLRYLTDPFDIDVQVAQKKLSATISSTPEDPSKIHIEFLTKSSTAQHTQATLNQALRMLTSTSSDLSYLDSRISTSRDFLSKAYAAAGKSGGPGGPGGMGVGAGFGAFDGMEEDLLAGGGAGGEFWEE